MSRRHRCPRIEPTMSRRREYYGTTFYPREKDAKLAEWAMHTKALAYAAPQSIRRAVPNAPFLATATAQLDLGPSSNFIV
jgi:hypothetical protein